MNDRMSELRSLCMELGEVESEIDIAMASLKKQRDLLREKISIIVASYDETVKIPGFGTLRITKPSSSTKYDPDMVEQVIKALQDKGEIFMAQALIDCRENSVRSGSLMIVKERKSDRKTRS